MIEEKHDSNDQTYLHFLSFLEDFLLILAINNNNLLIT